MKAFPPAVSNEASVIRQLRDDPEFAAEYLKVSFEEATDEEGRAVLLTALKRIAKARGLGKVAEQAGIPQESLSRALAPNGNPRLTTLLPLFRALGLKLTMEQAARG